VRNERVVRGGQEQERDAHPVDEAGAGALRVIVAGAFEAVHPRGQRVVELEERAARRTRASSAAPGNRASFSSDLRFSERKKRVR